MPPPMMITLYRESDMHLAHASRVPSTDAAKVVSAADLDSCATCQFTTKTTCVLWPVSTGVPDAVPVTVIVKIPTAVL
jgi:hypothetical protein